MLRHNMAERDRPRDPTTGKQIVRDENRDYYLRFPASEPAPIVTTQTAAWAWERPATTIVGSFSPQVAPGYRSHGDESRQNAPDSVTVELWEIGVLQGFPADYPWQGNKTKIGEQIGNAFPPGFAAAVVGQVCEPSDRVLVGFAGPGGTCVGISAHGIDPVGIEWDAAACATRHAAGLRTIRADMAHYPVERLSGVFDGCGFSPPCQAFSKAGKRDGLRDLRALYNHVRSCADGWQPYAIDGWADQRSPLVLEVLRWADAVGPRWVTCEQVPDVLPLWQAVAEILRGWGYSAWTGILDAADYGVPQHRTRAILIAAKDRIAAPPEPSHRANPEPSLFGGGGGAQHVSMAEALGWGMTGRPYMTVAVGHRDPAGVGGAHARAALERERERGWVVKTRGESGRSHDEFQADQPSRVVTGKSNSWKRE